MEIACRGTVSQYSIGIVDVWWHKDIVKGFAEFTRENHSQWPLHCSDSLCLCYNCCLWYWDCSNEITVMLSLDTHPHIETNHNYLHNTEGSFVHETGRLPVQQPTNFISMSILRDVNIVSGISKTRIFWRQDFRGKFKCHSNAETTWIGRTVRISNPSRQVFSLSVSNAYTWSCMSALKHSQAHTIPENSPKCRVKLMNSNS